MRSDSSDDDGSDSEFIGVRDWTKLGEDEEEEAEVLEVRSMANSEDVTMRILYATRESLVNMDIRFSF